MSNQCQFNVNSSAYQRCQCQFNYVNSCLMLHIHVFPLHCTVRHVVYRVSPSSFHSITTCHPLPPASPPTGRLCTATLPTNVTIQGPTTDTTLLCGVYYSLGGVLFSIFRCFVHATGTLMYSGTHRFKPDMLAFCLYI
jgi:hypothetical protein